MSYGLTKKFILQARNESFKTSNQKTENYFGHVGTARPGDLFASRQELAQLGQHRPLRAGVCGTAKHGIESLILADQYEDDEIYEDYFWYAGHGGRDAKTGHQATDQDLTHRNQAFIRSQETGQPVRVFRRIADLPASWQFRYEGLFTVVNHEYIIGKSGFKIYRFRLEPLLVKSLALVGAIS